MAVDKCGARRSNGEPCRLHVLAGSKRCKFHAGSGAARKKAIVRAELNRWGLGDTTLDPGEVLLRLVSQSAARVEFLSGLLEEQYDRADHGEELVTLSSRIAVMTGPTFALARTGEPVAIGEAIRALVQLEGEERDRCANFAARAIAAGLAERQVRLAERQGAMIADVLRSVLGDPELGLTESQRTAVPDLLRRHLSIVS